MFKLVEPLFKMKNFNKILSFPYFLNSKVALFTSPCIVLNTRFSVFCPHSHYRFCSAHIYSFVEFCDHFFLVTSFAWCFDFIIHFMYCKYSISMLFKLKHLLYILYHLNINLIKTQYL